MRLSVLGSGTVTPALERASSGYRLVGSVGSLNLDLGHGTLRNALKMGQRPWEWTDLAFSHIHPDHTSDLVPFLFARNCGPPPWNREAPISLWGPPGFGDFFESLCKPWPWISKEGAEPQIREYSGSFDVGGLQVTPHAVEHSGLPAFGFRIEQEGQVFSYSGDTRLCDGLRELAVEADLFLCECSLPEGYPQRGDHMYSGQVGRVAEEARVRRLLLTHIYPLPTEVDLVAEVKTEFRGRVELAEDLKVYEVRD